MAEVNRGSKVRRVCGHVSVKWKNATAVQEKAASFANSHSLS